MRIFKLIILLSIYYDEILVLGEGTCLMSELKIKQLVKKIDAKIAAERFSVNFLFIVVSLAPWVPSRTILCVCDSYKLQGKK